MSYYFYYYLRYSSLVRNIVQYFAAWLAESLRHNGNTYMGIQYSTVQHSTVQYSTVQYRNRDQAFKRMWFSTIQYRNRDHIFKVI